jgi:hypothetical protein
MLLDMDGTVGDYTRFSKSSGEFEQPVEGHGVSVQLVGRSYSCSYPTMYYPRLPCCTSCEEL